MKKSFEKLAGNFEQGKIGSAVKYFDVVDSTNRLALRLPDTEAPHGLTLVAGAQTAGRGREGRKWLSLADVGLHFTVLLRPKESGASVPLITFVGALAIYDVLSSTCDSTVDIHWPNDVMLAGGKVSGILGEALSSSAGVDRVALGISINVGHRQADFPSGITTNPISILMAEGKAPALDDVLFRTLREFNKWYDVLCTDAGDAVVEAVRKRTSFVPGKRLEIIVSGDKLKASVVAINNDGTLQIRLESGMEMTLQAGDVRVLD